jgi:hypothetical protein
VKGLETLPLVSDVSIVMIPTHLPLVEELLFKGDAPPELLTATVKALAQRCSQLRKLYYDFGTLYEEDLEEEDDEGQFHLCYRSSYTSSMFQEEFPNIELIN